MAEWEVGWYNACICCIAPFEEEDAVDPMFLRQDRKFGRSGFYCREVDDSSSICGGVQASGVSASADDESEEAQDEALRNIIAVGQSRFELAGKVVPPQDDVEYLSDRVRATQPSRFPLHYYGFSIHAPRAASGSLRAPLRIAGDQHLWPEPWQYADANRHDTERHKLLFSRDRKEGARAVFKNDRVPATRKSTAHNDR